MSYPEIYMAPITQVITPNHGQFTLKGRWSNQRAVNHVLHYMSVGSAGATPDAFATQAIRVASAWQDNLVISTTDNYTFLGVTWMQLSDGGAVGEVPPTAGKPIAGPSASQVAPPNVSVLVTKIVRARGRDEKNGRMFLIPPAEVTINEDGVLVPTDVTTLQAKVDAFLAASTDPPPITAENEWIMVIGSWKIADKPEGEAGGLWQGTSNEVASLRVESLAATQRRRMRG